MRSVTGPAATSTPVKSEPVAGPSRHTTPAANPAAATNGLNTPIQTPQMNGPLGRTAQPANVRNPPPPAAPTSEQSRHVSFAPQPAKPPQADPVPCSGEDDSFMLNSEDDAFFAGIDLGDEAGLTEDPDEGLGGPIDFDEGLGGVAGNVSFEPQRPPSPQPVRQPNPPLQHPPQPQQQQPQPQPQNSRPPQPPRRHQTTVPTSNQSLRNSSHIDPKQESASQRAAPSMGGFRFPIGEVCILA